MGNSFREAWNSVVDKVGKKISGRIKSSKPHEHSQDIFDVETDSIEACEDPQMGDLTFAETMQQGGVEAASFGTPRALKKENCPDTVRESVASGSPPSQLKPAGGKKITVFPARKKPLPPKKRPTQVVSQTASEIQPIHLPSKPEKPVKIEPVDSDSTLKALQPDYKITIEGQVTPNPCLINTAETKNPS